MQFSDLAKWMEDEIWFKHKKRKRPLTIARELGIKTSDVREVIKAKKRMLREEKEIQIFQTLKEMKDDKERIKFLHRKIRKKPHIIAKILELDEEFVTKEVERLKNEWKEYMWNCMCDKQDGKNQPLKPYWHA